MSLRLKLLLLSLITLILPWAGCRYAREMETTLRTAEEASLGAVARVMADSLQGRTDLLYRGSATLAASLGARDLEPVALASPPLLDGYGDDWPDSGAAVESFTAAGGDRLRVVAGTHERLLYLLLDVSDRNVVFDAPAANPLDVAKAGDRLWLAFQDAEGAEREVFLAASGVGPLQARHIEMQDLGEPVAVPEPRIAGAWQLRAGGYRLELRLPLAMLGERIGVLVNDRDARGATPVSYGSLDVSEPLRATGRLIAASPQLETYLRQVAQADMQLAVTTPDGVLLARANAPASANPPAHRGLLERIYRSLLVNPGDRRVIEATAPIFSAEPRRLLGKLQVARTTDRWLTLRDRALTTLLNLTLMTTLIAVLAMFAFAAHLGLRLARLRRASESALTRTGVNTAFPETTARDELGDVARSFATLLGRLDEYTSYLRTLAGKLAHEIRTPLTIVRSSLENLESEAAVPAQARTYVNRALEGSERLNAIVLAMGAASRVEESIQGAERSRFDLRELLSHALSAYCDAFPQRHFELDAPEGAVPLDGAPDLIVQMLDKLVDNAVDFSPPGATIRLRLATEAGYARLEIENPGPPLAPASERRIFESLWQSRSDGDGRPHFGLGLYIVRLIAEFHDGRAAAENLTGESGVRFTIHLSRSQ